MHGPLKNFIGLVAKSTRSVPDFLFTEGEWLEQQPSELALFHCYLQAELKQHKEEVQRLRAALLDSEAAVLQKERQIIDMKKQMKEEQRRAEAPLQMDQAVQADPIQHAHLAVQVAPC